jgi:hypothetical protein
MDVLREFETVTAVVGARDREALTLELGAHYLVHRGFVVDHEDRIGRFRAPEHPLLPSVGQRCNLRPWRSPRGSSSA